ncbi:hypothetical protein [Kitasatospora sp. NPDC094011]|uniref:hypothetical protein n=1 Tax=Kitasatospora sp. NPDC094011 TaxID=3364090 RepID=UPI0038177118
MKRNLIVPGKSRFGWSPLVTDTTYLTTYYHDDGTVTTQAWGLSKVGDWVPVSYGASQIVHAPGEL